MYFSTKHVLAFVLAIGAAVASSHAGKRDETVENIFVPRRLGSGGQRGLHPPRHLKAGKGTPAPEEETTKKPKSCKGSCAPSEVPSDAPSESLVPSEAPSDAPSEQTCPKFSQYRYVAVGYIYEMFFFGSDDCSGAPLTINYIPEIVAAENSYQPELVFDNDIAPEAYSTGFIGMKFFNSTATEVCCVSLWTSSFYGWGPDTTTANIEGRNDDNDPWTVIVQDVPLTFVDVVGGYYNTVVPLL